MIVARLTSNITLSWILYIVSISSSVSLQCPVITIISARRAFCANLYGHPTSRGDRNNCNGRNGVLTSSDSNIRTESQLRRTGNTNDYFETLTRIRMNSENIENGDEANGGNVHSESSSTGIPAETARARSEVAPVTMTPQAADVYLRETVSGTNNSDAGSTANNAEAFNFEQALRDEPGMAAFWPFNVYVRENGPRAAARIKTALNTPFRFIRRKLRGTSGDQQAAQWRAAMAADGLTNSTNSLQNPYDVSRRAAENVIASGTTDVNISTSSSTSTSKRLSELAEYCANDSLCPVCMAVEYDTTKAPVHIDDVKESRFHKDDSCYPANIATADDVKILLHREEEKNSTADNSSINENDTTTTAANQTPFNYAKNPTPCNYAMCRGCVRTMQQSEESNLHSCPQCREKNIIPASIQTIEDRREASIRAQLAAEAEARRLGNRLRRFSKKITGTCKKCDFKGLKLLSCLRQKQSTADAEETPVADNPR